MSAGDPAFSDRLAAIHERLIKTALGLRKCADKCDKRIRFLSLINESYLHPNITEKDLFAASYGDMSGREYWRGWCTPDWSPLVFLAKILAAHNAKAATVEERERYRERAKENNQFILYLHQERGLDLLKAPKTRQVLDAFAVAQRNCVPWMRGNLLGPPNNFFNEVTTRDIEVQRLCAVTWLAQHPDYEAIVPDSLHQFLGTSGPPAHLGRRYAEPLFVIEKELDPLLGNKSGLLGNKGNKPTSPRERRTPQREACSDAFEALYPAGIPDRKALSDQKLVGAVTDHMGKVGSVPASKDTILRAAGRKR